MSKNDRDTWPHLISMCEHPYLKGLRIALHNNAVHLITQNITSQQAHPITLINACNLNNTNQQQIVPEWLLERTCTQTKCRLQARLRLDVLCVLGAPNQTPTPLLPSHTHTIQFIEFTSCHDRYPEQALSHKHTNYDPLINAIWNKGWKTNPLITIIAKVRGAIHKQSITNRVALEIPKTDIKDLMKNIQQNAIELLTYLVLNKRKLDIKQTSVTPP